MIVKIIGFIVGILILCTGIYYLTREKEDLESRKIYRIVSVVGAVLEFQKVKSRHF